MQNRPVRQAHKSLATWRKTTWSASLVTRKAFVRILKVDTTHQDEKRKKRKKGLEGS